MKIKALSAIFLIAFIIVSCTPAIAAEPNTVQQSSQPELDPTRVPATIEASSNNPVIAGIHFSGQGPTTWPIQKDPGMALLHLKVENCSSLVISGKGQNIPYLPTKVVSTDQFEDQYQYYNAFQGSPDREETIVLDYPDPFEDFDAPPQTEMLRIEEVSDACKWEATILPLTAARSIEPGQVIRGEYNDVLAAGDSLRGVQLLFMSPGHDRMLQDFGSVIAISGDETTLIEESLEVGGLYANFPTGTTYLAIDSQGYWELQGE